MSTFAFAFGHVENLIAKCSAGKEMVTHDDLEELPSFMRCADIVAEHRRLADEALARLPPDDPILRIADPVVRDTTALPLWRAIFTMIRPNLLVLCGLVVIRCGAIFVQIFALSAIIDLVGIGSESAYDAHIAVELLLALLLGGGAWLQSLMQHNIFHNSWINGLRARALICAWVYEKALLQTPLHMGGASAAGARGSTAPGKASASTQLNGSSGQQVNLISSDSNVVIEALVMFAFLCSSPIEVFAALAWIFVLVDWAAFAALVVIAVLLPVQLQLGKLVGQLRGMSFSFADKRISMLSEFLAGIGVVKFNAWEQSIRDRVGGVRAQEARHLTMGTSFKLLNLSLFFVVPGILSLVTFGILNIYDTTMDGRTTFTVLALLQVIARTFAMIPRATTSMASAMASVARAESFLLKDLARNLPQDLGKAVAHEPIASEDSRGRVVVHGEFSWHRAGRRGHDVPMLTPSPGNGSPLSGGDDAAQQHPFALRGVSLTASPGTLTCIVGAVGTGKSTLLHAVMRNCAQSVAAGCDDDGVVDRVPEGVLCQGTVAYVPQEAWIHDGTVRDNILFGRELNEDLYWRVLCACSLLQDLKQWGGDLVEVGERGVTLSGGQRQRIAIARACYSDADIYLLDDPLSALDAVVVMHVLQNCICSPEMMGSKTVLLATHNPIAISKAHQIVTFDDNGWCLVTDTEDERAAAVAAFSVPPEDENHSGCRDISTAELAKGGNTVDSADQLAQDARALLGCGRVLETVEAIASSSTGVSSAVYMAYVKAGGNGSFIAFVIFLVLAQAVRNLSEWWFAVWTNRDYNLTNTQYVLIELALVLGSGIIAAMRSVIFSRFAVKASSVLHDRMFLAVLGSPMHFFESVPLGRIINRFSKDVDFCDDLLPRAAFDFLQLIVLALGSLGLLIFSIPWFAIVILFFLVIFTKLLRYYLPAARQLKRIEGASRSPSNQTFQSTLQGIASIRAYRCEGAWAEQFYRTVDMTSRAIITSDSSQRWVGVRMDWMTATWVFATGAFVIGLQSTLNRSIAGLALGQSLMLTGMLQYSVRQAAETESVMTSVERIDEFGHLPAEKDPFAGFPLDHAIADGAAPNEEMRGDDGVTAVGGARNQWPRHGHVVVRDLTVAYPSNPSVNVLRNVSFEILPGQKFALVGRTGAGKSSVLQCFFRFMSIPEDSIVVDGLLTSKLPLRTLRRGLGVIPQAPTLFHGTLRYNLDPFDEFSDDELVLALHKVQLLRRLLRTALSTEEDNGLSAALPDETAEPASSGDALVMRLLHASPTTEDKTADQAILDTLLPEHKEALLNLDIGEQGGALSVGQKQLVCAARVLLTDPKVLMLDETTANIDTATDAAFQHMIRDACASTTVIAIAHRLNTIMDYDVVCVLRHGEVVELGNPQELLRTKPSGEFASMVASSRMGDTEGDIEP